MAVVTIASNPFLACVISPTREIALQIQKVLSYKVEGAENTSIFKKGHWDGRSSFYEMRTGTFPTGFLTAVQSHLTRLGYDVKLLSDPLPAPLGPIKPKFDAWGYDDPRYDYHWETVERVTRYGRMIAQIATGGGKSRVAKMVSARIMRPTLFLTTRGVLMHQMRRHYVDLLEGLTAYHPELSLPSLDVGVLGDGVFAPSPWLNVGMVQTIASRLADPDPSADAEKQQAQKLAQSHMRDLLAKFELVILEEAHESAGGEYYDILNRCVNAKYRIALTATPFMRDDAEANMKLLAVSGAIAIRVSEQTLINRGILAKPYFKFISAPKPNGLYRSTKWPMCYEIGVVNNPGRNAAIVYEATRAAKYGLSVLILINRKSHGNDLLNQLRASGLKAAFIYGEHEQREREAWLKALESGKIQVLIGSTILDVGVDVPSIGMIIIGSGGKAEVQFRQRIGRGLRAKKTGPNEVYVVDFRDEHNNILMDHANQRFGIVMSTPGFQEGILKSGEDFDLAKFLAKAV